MKSITCQYMLGLVDSDTNCGHETMSGSAAIAAHAAGIAQVDIEINFLADWYLHTRHYGKKYTMGMEVTISSSEMLDVKTETRPESDVGSNAIGCHGKESFEGRSNRHGWVSASSFASKANSPVVVSREALAHFYVSYSIRISTFSGIYASLDSIIQPVVTMVVLARKAAASGLFFGNTLHLVHLIDKDTTITRLYLQRLIRHLFNNITTNNAAIFQVHRFGCLLCHQAHYRKPHYT